MVSCLNCAKETDNPRFCSRSCACTWTNIHNPRKKRINFRYCKTCGELLAETYLTHCRPCQAVRKTKINRMTDRTIGDIQASAKYQINAWIRSDARMVVEKAGRPRVCQQCGYDKHVEVCHYPAINSYPMTAKISEVNDQKNLLLLCPNHHWELDNGLLTL